VNSFLFRSLQLRFTKNSKDIKKVQIGKEYVSQDALLPIIVYRIQSGPSQYNVVVCVFFPPSY
jgi:hypothetical protein